MPANELLEDTMLTKTIRTLAVFGVVGYCGVSTAAVSDPPTPAELQERLIPIYHQVMGDPVVTAMIQQARVGTAGPEALDTLLERLPLSPLEMLRIDMRLHHFEVALPPAVMDLHTRWVALHEDLARSYYGDVRVDALLGHGVDGSYTAAAGATPAATVGTNRNVASGSADPPDDYQGEIQIAVDPANPSRVVAAANTFSGCSGDSTQSIFYSADGGATWDHTCSPSQAAYSLNCSLGTVFGSDPAVWWDGGGNVYLEHMLICSFFGLINQYAVVVATSSNGGTSWSGQGVVVNSWGGSTIEDKNFYAIDRWPSSSYQGHHYTCWDRDNNEKFAYSANSGATWTEVDLPSAPVGGVDLGCEIAVAKNGTVHVVFDSLSCGSSDCTDERMFHTRSTDGGVTWSTPVQVQDFNLVGFSGANTPDVQDSRGISPFGAVDIDGSGGACDGTLYAVFSDYEVGGSASTTDVWVRRSIDNGATWLPAVRVNDDGAGGNTQFHPFLAVDQSSGDVVVVWHDARNDVQNRAVEIFLARSTDCGVSFESNVQATAPSAEFNNSGISSVNLNTSANSGANPNQFGEYLGLDVVSGTAYLAWTDTRHYFPSFTSESEKENVGFATVVFADPSSIFANDFESGGTSAWSVVSSP
jgi:hypothetical protein